MAISLARSTLRPPMAIYSITSLRHSIREFVAVLWFPYSCVYGRQDMNRHLSHVLRFVRSFISSLNFLSPFHEKIGLAVHTTSSLFITFFILFVVFGTLCFVETLKCTNGSKQQLFDEQKECQKYTSPIVGVSGKPLLFTMFKFILVQFQHLHEGCFDLASKKRWSLKNSNFNWFFEGRW